MSRFFVAIVILSLVACTAQVTPETPALSDSQSASDTLRPEGCTSVEVNYDLTVPEVVSEYNTHTTVFSPKPSLNTGTTGRAAALIDSRAFQGQPRAAGTRSEEVCWFHLKAEASVKVLSDRIEADGKYLVGDLWELHSLRLARPDLLVEFSLKALGSKWRGPMGWITVPYSYKLAHKDKPTLSWASFPVEGHEAYFVAVRK